MGAPSYIKQGHEVTYAWKLPATSGRAMMLCQGYGCMGVSSYIRQGYEVTHV